jgi:hypothetical protein
VQGRLLGLQFAVFEGSQGGGGGGGGALLPGTSLAVLLGLSRCRGAHFFLVVPVL